MEPEQVILGTLVSAFFRGAGWPKYQEFRVTHEEQRHLLDELVARGWLTSAELYKVTLLGLAHTEGPVALDLRSQVRTAVRKLKDAYRAAPGQPYKTSDDWMKDSNSAAALEMLWPLGVLVRFSKFPDGGVQLVEATERILDLADDLFGPTGWQTTTPGTVAFGELTFQNILSFGPEAPSLRVTPLTVLIGANGTGKSNFLEMLELLRCVPDSLNDTLKPTPEEWLFQSGFKRAAQGSVRVSLEGGNLPSRLTGLEYSLTFAASGGRERILEERLMGTGPMMPGTDPQLFLKSSGGSATVNVVRGGVRWLERQPTKPASPHLQELDGLALYPEAATLRGALRAIRVYRGFPTDPGMPIREAQDPRASPDRLEADGHNLCVVLGRLQEHTEVWRTLLGELRDVYHPITNLTVKAEAGKLVLRAEEEHGSTSAARLSDGTLKYICLLAVLLDPEPPPLVALDEPEAGLHPDAISGLAHLLDSASSRCQVIVTTHSTMLLDNLQDPESIVVCDREDGGTVLKRLAPDALAKWLAVYEGRTVTIGELWMRGHLGGTRW